jgi:hypothetical protein
MKKTYLLLSVIPFFLWNCSSTKNTSKIKISSLHFIGEQVIPANTIFQNTKVGGLSSIEYANEKYYLISDDKDKPIRFYEMKLDYNQNDFNDVTITKVIKIENNSKGIDPESLRFDKNSTHFYWTSEGYSRKGINPTVFEIDKNGKAVKTHQTPKIFQAKYNTKTYGTRRNGTFEGLSMSINPDFYWVGMELPLKQDGEEPLLEKGNYPIRISKINKKTDELIFQFVYQLDKIPKNSIPENKFIVNGCPEILEIDENRFLFLERAYASGHKDGGNTVKIYLVDSSKASDVSKINSLTENTYAPAKKTLLFNFDTIRNQLTNGIVDNIEGISFGKTLANGNKTIVVVSDNNFNKFNPQLNQLIVFEVLK